MTPSLPPTPGRPGDAPPSRGRVLLVHGIWNHHAWLRPLAARLRAEGFEPEIFPYASVLEGPDVAVPALVARLRELGPVPVVAHSLGGLVTLEALHRAPDIRVPRAVFLGAPLRGSAAARSLAGRPWLGRTLGRSGALLQRGFERWDGATRIGMVAGTVPRGFGQLIAPFAGDNDGTVGIEETRLPGLAEHCAVACSHTGLVFAPGPARLAARFLRNGRFAA